MFHGSILFKLIIALFTIVIYLSIDSVMMTIMMTIMMMMMMMMMMIIVIYGYLFIIPSFKRKQVN